MLDITNKLGRTVYNSKKETKSLLFVRSYNQFSLDHGIFNNNNYNLGALADSFFKNKLPAKA